MPVPALRVEMMA
jgi:hypothetical protein